MWPPRSHSCSQCSSLEIVKQEITKLAACKYIWRRCHEMGVNSYGVCKEKLYLWLKAHMIPTSLVVLFFLTMIMVWHGHLNRLLQCPHLSLHPKEVPTDEMCRSHTPQIWATSDRLLRASFHHGPWSRTMEDGPFSMIQLDGPTFMVRFRKISTYKTFGPLTRCKPNVDREE